MNDFLKVSLRGLIITLLLPFIVAFLLLYTVYCLLSYLIMFIRNAVIFFMGGSPKDLKEDIIARRAMETQTKTENDMAVVLSDLMHSAIKQNPEAVRAMAQQEIATQQISAQPNPNPTPTPQNNFVEQDNPSIPNDTEIKSIDVVEETPVIDAEEEISND